MKTLDPILVLNGTVAVGKTVVGEAVSEILEAHKIPHAFVDTDALSRSWPPRGRFNEEVVLRNLASVWLNFKDAGADRMIVAGVVETGEDLKRYRHALGADLIVCRLLASQDICEARLKARDSGTSLEWHLARTKELEAILELASLEDFSILNEDRSVVEVAKEILGKVGWLPNES